MSLSAPIGRGMPVPAWITQQQRERNLSPRAERSHGTLRSKSPSYHRIRSPVRDHSRSRSSSSSPRRHYARHRSRSPPRSRRSLSPSSRRRSPYRHSRHSPIELPRVGSILRGTVTRLEKFGAFVRLEGYRREGLIHISQLASRRVDDIEDAIGIDEQVWVKVVNVVCVLHE